ncbi:hypothetical protein GLW36_11755 [Halorubrum terrestre]|uniref:Uncharacterized protein n=1 Tax=Halorubrum distributum TaxID=29283 RepID=A0A6B1I928_9EURY|nr:hypothetical protein [Halorubrum terrestre]MYL17312.1 hypothetical protein [Halorubrum terrestre]
MNRSNLESAVSDVAQTLDNAITDPNDSLLSAIKGKHVITPIEDFVAEELVDTYNFNPTAVKQDAKVYGKVKTKEHDIVVSPKR